MDSELPQEIFAVKKVAVEIIWWEELKFEFGGAKQKQIWAIPLTRVLNLKIFITWLKASQLSKICYTFL